jgi:hypothetical protein
MPWSVWVTWGWVVRQEWRSIAHGCLTMLILVPLDAVKLSCRKNAHVPKCITVLYNRIGRLQGDSLPTGVCIDHVSNPFCWSFMLRYESERNQPHLSRSVCPITTDDSFHTPTIDTLKTTQTLIVNASECSPVLLIGSLNSSVWKVNLTKLNVIIIKKQPNTSVKR